MLLSHIFSLASLFYEPYRLYQLSNSLCAATSICGNKSHGLISPGFVSGNVTAHVLQIQARNTHKIKLLKQIGYDRGSEGGVKHDARLLF